MRTIAFFHSTGNIGTTAFVYHLAQMFADHGLRVVAVDLDPQANLTSMFLEEDDLDRIWSRTSDRTIYESLRPLLEGEGDIGALKSEAICKGLSLIVGDLALSQAEDELSSQWPDCLDRKPRAFRVLSAIFRVIHQVGRDDDADLALLDVGPNLGALNRAALLCAQFVVVPLAPDIYSLQGLSNLGPTLKRWRAEWQERLSRNPLPNLDLPQGEMSPLGYVVMQHGLRDNRPVKAYKRWMDKIPQTYASAVLDAPQWFNDDVLKDPRCLALLKHYRSLMPLAMEAHKPMFQLRPADGAIGAHVAAVQSCYDDFHRLARRIGASIDLELE